MRTSSFRQEPKQQRVPRKILVLVAAALLRWWSNSAVLFSCAAAKHNPSAGTVPHNPNSRSTTISKHYDVYIIVTPPENSIGEAAAQAVAEGLSESKTDPDTTSVVCQLPLGLPQPRLSKQTLWNRIQPSWFRFRKGSSSPPSSCASDGNPWDVGDLVFDPFGDPAKVQESAKKCLEGICHQVFRSMVATEQTSNDGDDATLLSATVSIRGILYNPYGRGHVEDDEELRPHRGDDNQGSKTDNKNQAATTSGSLAPSSSQLSSLASYKLVSMAILLDTAVSMRSTKLELTRGEVAGGRAPTPIEVAAAPKRHPQLRFVLVGTEAARGLPKMGIPVPELEDATESSIHNKLLVSQALDPAGWEKDYAEMNALAALYLKGVARRVHNGQFPNYDATAWQDCYLGIVSPGMTPESFRMCHVPPASRTLAFRFKLWLCSLPPVFRSLVRSEIAKTTEEAGKLMACALLNAALGAGSTEDRGRPIQSWDDAYPSGSFVGARSGTGGPLCEQSKLVYNATSGTMGLPVHAEPGEENFLGSPRLQAMVYHLVRIFVPEGRPIFVPEEEP